MGEAALMAWMVFEQGIASTFPVGTMVDVYPAERIRPARRVPDAPAPQRGRAAISAVVASHGLELEGLRDGERYVAHAEVGGEQRFVDFRARSTPHWESPARRAQERARIAQLEPAPPWEPPPGYTDPYVRPEFPWGRSRVDQSHRTAQSPPLPS